tara:strand:+ start:336 stop:779 length:444 start_codon:yes stop_codon:yes gene_type:complete
MKTCNDLPNINRLYTIVCKTLSLTKEQLKSRSRKREYVEGRIIFANLALSMLHTSTLEAGYLVNRDHSSVVHYRKNHNEWYGTDKVYTRAFDLCRNAYEPQKEFILSKSLTIDDKLSVAYVTIKTLEEENKKLREEREQISTILNIL